uniref:Ltp family lipoprotein n=1 Tax=Collinsella bouchesdurhonensis TaxID=1907654 RepID=UPI00359C2795
MGPPHAGQPLANGSSSADSSSEIDYAIEHCGANWNEQCAECAQSYLDSMSMSRSELYEQLEYEGFTSSQIEYGLAAVGY